MSDASQQNDKTIKELISYFKDHPFITVTPTSPTNSTEVEVRYRLTGLIEDKEVHRSQDHAILLSIPFGFPLFPPNCKPLTPTFHPDFDPGAICLGNFWTDETTCIELVEFISRMIIGEVYSKENAFNEKAAQWYATHADDFPLAELDQIALPPHTPDAGEEEFTIDFGDIELESEDKGEEVTPPPHKKKCYNLSLLQQHLAQRRFSQLSRELQAIPVEIEFAERQSFQQRTDKALLVAQTKQEEALVHEKNDEPQEALDKYRQALEEVSDLYHIKDNIKRLEQAAVLKKKEEKKPLPTKKGSQKNILCKIPTIPTLIILSVISAVTALQFFKDNNRATSAAGLYQQCTTALEQKEFRTAQALCESAQLKSSASSFFYGDTLSRIERESKKILLSPQLKQGLMAKLSHKKFSSKKSRNKSTSFTTIIREAQGAITKQDWPQADMVLRQAQSSAQTDKEKKLVIQTKAEMRFYQAHEKASTEYKKNGCKTAEPLFKIALQRGQTLTGESVRQTLQDISFHLNKCNFEQLTMEGDTLYKTANWSQALTLYQRAMKMVQNNPMAQQESIAKTQKKIGKIATYTFITQGNEAFNNGAWTEAITAYKRAISSLEAQGIPQSAEGCAISSKKLKRIILQTKIIQGQQMGQAYRDDKLFTQAIETYQHISTTINQSGFAKEPSFAHTYREIQSDLAELKKEKFIEEKRVALQKQQMDIFLKNYPAATPETLEDHKILFIKDEMDKLIYRMEATDTSQNRPLTLVMYYAYNKTTDQWQFTPRPEAEEKI